MTAAARKIRWGILGVAKINDRLIPALHKAPNAELRAIASRSLDKARHAANAGNIPIPYGSYEELLRDPNIDAVYVPQPNSLHAEWTMKAAEHGKHVLCEKPLASDAAEAQRVVDFCRARNVRLMEGFMWPHHPRTAKLRKFLDAGGIGDIRQVVSAFTFVLPSDPKNIRLQPDMAGGSVMDIGCYPIYAARWALGGEPKRVFAVAEWQSGVDVRMNAVMEFPGGRTASFDCGFTSPYRDWLEITGTEGSVCVMNIWQAPSKAAFEVNREGKRVETVVVEGEDQIVHMIENLGRAIKEGRDPVPGPEQAVANMNVLDAVRKSAKEGRAVEV